MTRKRRAVSGAWELHDSILQQDANQTRVASFGFGRIDGSARKIAGAFPRAALMHASRIAARLAPPVARVAARAGMQNAMGQEAKERHPGHAGGQASPGAAELPFCPRMSLERHAKFLARPRRGFKGIARV